jgi:hypothetical protein
MKMFHIRLAFGFSFLPLLACRTQPTALLKPPQAGKQLVAETGQTEFNRTSPDGSIRQNGIVKVYGINRYVDPTDPTIMHERHAIYRLEQQPSWVTRSSRNRPEVILGPIVGLRKPEYEPEPLPGETTQQLVKVRRNTEEIAKAVATSRDNQERLAGQVAGLARQTADAEQKLTTVLSMLNERVKKLEGENGIESDNQADAKTGPAVPNAAR